MVIDLGAVKTINKFQAYQMFSDGKTTHIQVFSHSNTSSAPVSTDSNWISLAPESTITAGSLSGNTVSSPSTVNFSTIIT